MALAAGCEGSGGDSADSPAFTAPDGGFDAALSPNDGGAADAANDSGDAGLSARAIELAKMQAHLDSLYSPSDVVHRFTTPLGDKVDCLPFVKQPGFSLVGSINGVVPPEMTFNPPVGTGSEAGLGTGLDLDGFARGCPSGAVPIRHLELADLARFDTLEDFLSRAPKATSPDVETHQHGGWSQFDVPNWGAQSTFNLWQPAVEPNDFSLSQLWIVDGLAGAQTAETGYTEYPLQYGTNDPRLFIYSTADSYHNSDGRQCYDLTCAAFTQLPDTHVLLGGRFDKTSVMNGQQRVFRLRFQYCPASQCQDWSGWWLRYTGGTIDEWVGFYPGKRYAAGPLSNGTGTRVDFGGEVYYMANIDKPHTTTDMGSGQSPDAGFGAAAYQTDLQMITTANAWSELGAMGTISERSGCYTQGAVLPSDPGVSAWTRGENTTFYFGGTGYSEECQ